MVGMITHPAIARPYRLLTVLAFAAAAGACANEVKPPKPSRWTRLAHPTISYTLTMPATWEGEVVQEPAPGWRFRRKDGTAWGAAWTRVLSDPFGRPEDYRQTELRGLHDWDERALRARARAIGVADVAMLTVGDLAGLDRDGWPVRTRQYSLRLPTVNPPFVNQLTHWAASVFGGRGWESPEGNAASRAELIFATTIMHDAFGRPLRSNGSLQALHAVWSWVPERIEAEVVRREILDWARNLPYSTKFAKLSAIEAELAPSTTRPRIVLAAAVEGRRGTFSPLERERIGNAVREALKGLPLDDIVLEAGWIRGCDGVFAGAEVGGEPLVRSIDADFVEVLMSRYVDLADDEALCDGNPLLRAAILGVEGLGRRWQDADQRWLLLVSKTADSSPSPEDPDVALPPSQLATRLSESKPDLMLVGAFARGCTEISAQAEARGAESLRQLLSSIDADEMEYCADWPTALADGWSARSAAAGGLALAATPLPGTLAVADDAARPVTADPVRGYTYVHEYRALRGGSLVRPRAESPWTVRYEALIEPDVTP